MKITSHGLTAEWPDEGGDLVITASAEAREAIKDALEQERPLQEIEFETLEPLINNGLDWISPEQVGALTNAPMLCDGDPVPDSTNSDGPGNVWAFMDYELRSFAEDLRDEGRAVWTWGGKAEKKSEPKEVRP